MDIKKTVKKTEKIYTLDEVLVILTQIRDSLIGVLAKQRLLIEKCDSMEVAFDKSAR